MGALLSAPGPGILKAARTAWLDEASQNEMLRISENFQGMQGDIEQILATPEGYRQLVLAALLIKNTKSLIDENAAPALGVGIGFNAIDAARGRAGEFPTAAFLPIRIMASWSLTRTQCGGAG